MIKQFVLIFLTSVALLSCNEKAKGELVNSPKRKKELKKLADAKEGVQSGMQTSEKLIELDSLIHNLTNHIINKKGKFEIKFPVNGTIKIDTTTQLIDDQETVIYSYNKSTNNPKALLEGNFGYRADYCKLELTRQEVNNFFKTQKEYLLSVSNGRLEYEFVLDKPAVGRELMVSLDQSNLKTKYRMFYKNGIIYKLIVVSPAGEHFNSGVKNFLESFKIHD